MQANSNNDAAISKKELEDACGSFTKFVEEFWVEKLGKSMDDPDDAEVPFEEVWPEYFKFQLCGVMNYPKDKLVLE